MNGSVSCSTNCSNQLFYTQINMELWRGFIYLTKIGNVHIIKSKGGAIKIGLLNFDVVVMLKTSDAVFRFYVSVFSNQ